MYFDGRFQHLTEWEEVSSLHQARVRSWCYPPLRERPQRPVTRSEADDALCPARLTARS